MKLLVPIITAGILLGCSRSNIRDSEAGLQEGLAAYFGGLRRGEQRVTIDMMDPRFFPTPEAKQGAIRLLEDATTTFVCYGVTNGKAFNHFRGSNSLHCFVPYVMDAQMAKQRGTGMATQRATVKSYLLATRYDGSNVWFFVDVGRKSRPVLAQYYDNLPNKLPQASMVKEE